MEETLEGPLDCKEIEPVHLKEISPGCSLEGMMLKLKLQYFGHLMQRVDSWEKPLMKVKVESEKVGLKLNIQKTKIIVPSLHGK